MQHVSLRASPTSPPSCKAKGRNRLDTRVRALDTRRWRRLDTRRRRRLDTRVRAQASVLKVGYKG